MLHISLSLMQFIGGTYILSIGSIHYVNMGKFSTWSQRVLNMPSDNLYKDSIWSLWGMVKARMSNITKQALKS